MFCKNCGTEISDGDGFCPNCGNPVGSGKRGVAKRENTGRNKKTLPFVIGGGVALLVILFIVFSGKGGDKKAGGETDPLDKILGQWTRVAVISSDEVMELQFSAAGLSRPRFVSITKNTLKLDQGADFSCPISDLKYVEEDGLETFQFDAEWYHREMHKYKYRIYLEESSGRLVMDIYSSGSWWPIMEYNPVVD